MKKIQQKMDRKLAQFCFTMVEIALALAVLLIGISSILVLFPVGINATRSAVANNNLADIAEYMMSYLRAGCVAEWANVAKNPSNPNPYFFTQNMATSAVSGVADDGINLNLDDYKDDASNGNRISSNLYKITVTGSDNSAFLYEQKTGTIIDFAAVVKVWQDSSSKIYFKHGNDKTTVTSAAFSGIGSYARTLCVEISWPAEAPYAQRETRLFRQEIFNEFYQK